VKRTKFPWYLAALACCACADAAAANPPAAPPGGPPPGGPPPIPPYQMRAPLPPGDRLTGGKDGAALFSNRCGACHLAGGMGTNMLTKQRVAAGQPPQSGLLANRRDLTRTYVKFVVRHGRQAMPRLTRVEVTDAELESIAQYLGKGGE
jgi:mono/diheme cytochrome c family protein